MIEKQKNPQRVANGKRFGPMGGRPRGKTPYKVVCLPKALVDEIDGIVGNPHKRVRWIVAACRAKIDGDARP